MIKNLNLSTKVIIPVFIIGILTSLTSFYYINEALENIVEDEIQQKIYNRIDHFEDYFENEYRLLTKIDKTKENIYTQQEEIAKKNIIELLKKETINSKDIVYIITPKDTKLITSSILNDTKMLREISKEDEVTINEIRYKIESTNFKEWDWELVLVHNISNFDAILYENRSFIFTMTFILLASLFIMLIIIFHFNISKPLNILFKHLEKISKGQYDMIDHSFNTKEFQSLASYIDVMTLSVELREKDAKNLLAKTKESEDYIYDILNSQENIIIVRDTKEIQTANNAFFKLFSTFNNIEEFKKHHNSIGEFFEKGEGLVYNFEDMNWIDYVLKQKEKTHKVKIKKGDKEYFYALNAIKSQKYPRVIISLTDITKLEESNTLLSEYKKAVDAAAIVSKTDTKGNITYVNDKFIKISGFKEEELIGKNHNILRSKNVKDELFKDLWKTITNKKIWHGEIENVNKQGESYYVTASIAPILNQKSEIIEYIGIRYDITDQVKAKERALKAEEAKGQFLANMSHEIRTPLNAIIGFTKILSNMKQDIKTEKYVSIIDKSANNLLGIVNDILDLSKIETGHLELEEVKFNPFEEFDSVINLFTAKVLEKKLELIYFIDPKIPQELLGDPLRLKQVLSNLISNAIKFTKEGHINIRIELIKQFDKNCQIKFIVQDTGIGIEKDKQKQIFSAFSQADNSISRQFGGTGLGLSISSKIIESFNSKINISSQINKGTKLDFDVEFEVTAKGNKHLEKFKKINTYIYNSEKTNKLLLGVIQEYLEFITCNNKFDNNDLKNLEMQDIIFVHESCIDQNIEHLSNKGVKIVIITNEDKDYTNLRNFITITTPINLSILFNILIETIDKSHILPNHETLKNYNKYDAKVLIVEDHKINQELISILFDLRDIKYKIANNGQEAIDIIKDENFHLIFMDINMPIKNGLDATKEIRIYEKENKIENTPIIALSANAIDSEKKKALEVGMNDYLYKPIDEDALDSILKKYIKVNKKPNILEVSKVSNFDLNTISKELGLSNFIVKKLINKFCKTIDSDLNLLKESIENKDLYNIELNAHKIKGAALNLRLKDVSEFSGNIESNSKNNEFNFKQELRKLEESINEIKNSSVSN